MASEHKSSKPSEPIFACRVVTIDYYLGNYISKEGDILVDVYGRPIKVPIIRIFGATPTGQKCCLHVRDVYPYFYVDFKDIKEKYESIDDYLVRFEAALEERLRFRRNGNSEQASSNDPISPTMSTPPTGIKPGGNRYPTKLVRSIELVRGVPYYGFHFAGPGAPEALDKVNGGEGHVFLRITLYNPRLIRRAATILQSGEVMGQIFQPHEAHIPYLMQFFLDWGVNGMAYLFAKDLRFRYPICGDPLFPELYVSTSPRPLLAPPQAPSSPPQCAAPPPSVLSPASSSELSPILARRVWTDANVPSRYRHAPSMQWRTEVALQPLDDLLSLVDAEGRFIYTQSRTSASFSSEDGPPILRKSTPPKIPQFLYLKQWGLVFPKQTPLASPLSNNSLSNTINSLIQGAMAGQKRPFQAIESYSNRVVRIASHPTTFVNDTEGNQASTTGDTSTSSNVATKSASSSISTLTPTIVSLSMKDFQTLLGLLPPLPPYHIRTQPCSSYLNVTRLYKRLQDRENQDDTIDSDAKMDKQRHNEGDERFHKLADVDRVRGRMMERYRTQQARYFAENPTRMNLSYPSRNTSVPFQSRSVPTTRSNIYQTDQYKNYIRAQDQFSAESYSGRYAAWYREIYPPTRESTAEIEVDIWAEDILNMAIATKPGKIKQEARAEDTKRRESIGDELSVRQESDTGADGLIEVDGEAINDREKLAASGPTSSNMLAEGSNEPRDDVNSSHVSEQIDSMDGDFTDSSAQATGVSYLGTLQFSLDSLTVQNKKKGKRKKNGATSAQTDSKKVFSLSELWREVKRERQEVGISSSLDSISFCRNLDVTGTMLLSDDEEGADTVEAKQTNHGIPTNEAITKASELLKSANDNQGADRRLRRRLSSLSNVLTKHQSPAHSNSPTSPSPLLLHSSLLQPRSPLPLRHPLDPRFSFRSFLLSLLSSMPSLPLSSSLVHFPSQPTNQSSSPFPPSLRTLFTSSFIPPPKALPELLRWMQELLQKSTMASGPGWVNRAKALPHTTELLGSQPGIIPPKVPLAPPSITEEGYLATTILEPTPITTGFEEQLRLMVLQDLLRLAQHQKSEVHDSADLSFRVEKNTSVLTLPPTHPPLFLQSSRTSDGAPSNPNALVPTSPAARISEQLTPADHEYFTPSQHVSWLDDSLSPSDAHVSVARAAIDVNAQTGFGERLSRAINVAAPNIVSEGKEEKGSDKQESAEQVHLDFTGDFSEYQGSREAKEEEKKRREEKDRRFREYFLMLPTPKECATSMLWNEVLFCMPDAALPVAHKVTGIDKMTEIKMEGEAGFGKGIDVTVKQEENQEDIEDLLALRHLYDSQQISATQPMQASFTNNGTEVVVVAEYGETHRDAEEMISPRSLLPLLEDFEEFKYQDEDMRVIEGAEDEMEEVEDHISPEEEDESTEHVDEDMVPATEARGGMKAPGHGSSAATAEAPESDSAEELAPNEEIVPPPVSELVPPITNKQRLYTSPTPRPSIASQIDSILQSQLFSQIQESFTSPTDSQSQSPRQSLAESQLPSQMAPQIASPSSHQLPIFPLPPTSFPSTSIRTAQSTAVPTDKLANAAAVHSPNIKNPVLQLMSPRTPVFTQSQPSSSSSAPAAAAAAGAALATSPSSSSAAAAMIENVPKMQPLPESPLFLLPPHPSALPSPASEEASKVGTNGADLEAPFSQFTPPEWKHLDYAYPAFFQNHNSVPAIEFYEKDVDENPPIISSPRTISGSESVATNTTLKSTSNSWHSSIHSPRIGEKSSELAMQSPLSIDNLRAISKLSSISKVSNASEKLELNSPMVASHDASDKNVSEYRTFGESVEVDQAINVEVKEESTPFLSMSRHMQQIQRGSGVTRKQDTSKIGDSSSDSNVVPGTVKVERSASLSSPIVAPDIASPISFPTGQGHTTKTSTSPIPTNQPMYMHDIPPTTHSFVNLSPTPRYDLLLHSATAPSSTRSAVPTQMSPPTPPSYAPLPPLHSKPSIPTPFGIAKPIFVSSKELEDFAKQTGGDNHHDNQVPASSLASENTLDGPHYDSPASIMRSLLHFVYSKHIQPQMDPSLPTWYTHFELVPTTAPPSLHLYVDTASSTIPSALVPAQVSGSATNPTEAGHEGVVCSMALPVPLPTSLSHLQTCYRHRHVESKEVAIPVSIQVDHRHSQWQVSFLSIASTDAPAAPTVPQTVAPQSTHAFNRVERRGPGAAQPYSSLDVTEGSVRIAGDDSAGGSSSELDGASGGREPVKEGQGTDQIKPEPTDQRRVSFYSQPESQSEPSQTPQSPELQEVADLDKVSQGSAAPILPSVATIYDSMSASVPSSPVISSLSPPAPSSLPTHYTLKVPLLTLSCERTWYRSTLKVPTYQDMIASVAKMETKPKARREPKRKNRKFMNKPHQNTSLSLSSELDFAPLDKNEVVHVEVLDGERSHARASKKRRINDNTIPSKVETSLYPSLVLYDRGHTMPTELVESEVQGMQSRLPCYLQNIFMAMKEKYKHLPLDIPSPSTGPSPGSFGDSPAGSVDQSRVSDGEASILPPDLERPELTIVSMEVFQSSQPGKVPVVAEDPVLCITYTVHAEKPESGVILYLPNYPHWDPNVAANVSASSPTSDMAYPHSLPPAEVTLTGTSAAPASLPQRIHPLPVMGAQSVWAVSSEEDLYWAAILILRRADPDIILTWDMRRSGVYALYTRAEAIGIPFRALISRFPFDVQPRLPFSLQQAPSATRSRFRSFSSNAIGGRIHLCGRREMKKEGKMYQDSLQHAVSLFQKEKIPYFTQQTLIDWWFPPSPSDNRVLTPSLSLPIPIDIDRESSNEGENSGTNANVQNSPIRMSTSYPIPRTLWRVVEYTLQCMHALYRTFDGSGYLSRYSEMARLYGTDLLSAMTRGSQFQVESIMMRVVKSLEYLAPSASRKQVAHQQALRCLPLILEPVDQLPPGPVIALDFQSLYPSLVIAYNMCFSTCLGSLHPTEDRISPSLGFIQNHTLPAGALAGTYHPVFGSHYEATGVRTTHVTLSYPEGDCTALPTGKKAFQRPKRPRSAYIAPNGTMFAPYTARVGVLPMMLREILEARIMVKRTMSRVAKDSPLYRILDARQFVLKMIANVTYGYVSAGFSGRMPCCDIADAIVHTGQETLRRAVRYVESHPDWNAKVVYGDTDSLFVALPAGVSKEDAFVIGKQIARDITRQNPRPVVLRMDKVYAPGVFVSKKRYAGAKFESPEEPKFTLEAKGVEAVRRDSCPLLAGTVQGALEAYFARGNLDDVRKYLESQWDAILHNRVPMWKYIFSKEVKLGHYAVGVAPPPAAVVALQAMEKDPGMQPLYGERVRYVVVAKESTARLVDCVYDPLYVLQMPGNPLPIHTSYYIKNLILPSVDRIFGPGGVNVFEWYTAFTQYQLKQKKKHRMPLYSSSLYSPFLLQCRPSSTAKSFPALPIHHPFAMTSSGSAAKTTIISTAITLLESPIDVEAEVTMETENNSEEPSVATTSSSSAVANAFAVAFRGRGGGFGGGRSRVARGRNGGRREYLGGTLEQYFASAHCVVCGNVCKDIPMRPKRGEDTENNVNLCPLCKANQQSTLYALSQKRLAVEEKLQERYRVCMQCTGIQDVSENGARACVSLDCEVFFDRTALHQELQDVVNLLANLGFD